MWADPRNCRPRWLSRDSPLVGAHLGHLPLLVHTGNSTSTIHKHPGICAPCPALHREAAWLHPKAHPAGVHVSECCAWPDAGTAPGPLLPPGLCSTGLPRGVCVEPPHLPPAGLGLRSPEAPSPYLSPLCSPRSGRREHSKNECPALLPRAVLPGDQTPSHTVPQERAAPQGMFLPCPESARRGSNHRNDGVSRGAHGSVRGRVLTVLLSPCHLSNAAFLPGWTLLCTLTLSSW